MVDKTRLGNFNFFLKTFLGDFAILLILSQIQGKIMGNFYMLQFRDSFKVYMCFLVLFAIIFTMSAYIVSSLSKRFYFKKPKSILWFMPLLHMVISCSLFISVLYILPELYNPWFWSELTGLDMTRVREFIIDLYRVLTINCVIMILFSINFYFRYHVIYQVVKKFPEMTQPVIDGSSNTVFTAMVVILLILMFYVINVSPDYLAVVKIKLIYRLNRNAEAAVKKTENFMRLYPNSRFIDGLYYFLGKLYFRDLGQLKKAQKCLKILCENHPENVCFPEGMKYLIEIHVKQGNDAEAHRLLTKFKEICPASPLLDDILILFARRNMEKGNTEDALRIFEEIETQFSDGMIMEFDKEDNFISYEKTSELAGVLRNKIRVEKSF